MQSMTEEARKARRAYMREYRKANREKLRENNIRYWERRAARLIEASADDETVADNTQD